MENYAFSFRYSKFLGTFVLWIFSSIFLFSISGCNPTSEQAAELTGVTTSTGNGPSITIAGTLGNYALTLYPASKDFGTLATNSGTSTQTFTVTNTSIYTVYMGTLNGATTHYTINSGTCTTGMIFVPFATCSFTVTFAPLTSGNLGSNISITYGSSPGSYTFYSQARVDGAGTTLTGFNGLDSLSSITTTSMILNWTGVAAADSYQLYQVVSGSAVLVTSQPSANVCVGTVCTYSVTGLTPSTTYNYRVRATDSFSIQEQNSVTRTASTFSGSIALTSAATTANSGRCTLFTVQAKDSGNNPVVMVSNTSVTIGGLGSGSIFSNSTCTSSLSGVTILSGQSSENFYYKNPTAESITMTASLSTYTAGSKSFSTTSGQLTLTGASTSWAGTTCTAITLSTLDTTGAAMNMITDAAVTMSGLGNGGTYSDAACTTSYTTPIVSSGSSSKIFYYKNTTAQAITMTANISLYATTAGTLSHTVIPNTADHFTYVSGNNQATTIGAISANIVVKLVDAYENPITGQSIAFHGIRGGAQPTTTLVTTDSSGLATNTFRLRGQDVKNQVKVTKVGGLPDAAGSGNSTYIFSATAYTGNNGVMNGRSATAFATAGTCSGDLNQDGKPDMVVMSDGSANIGVFINNGNGTFATRVDYATIASYPYNCQIANINGDTWPDIIVANYASAGASSGVSVFLNSGTGTFPTRADYITAASGMVDVKLADFTGDGVLDLVSAGYASNMFYYRTGVGDGTFGAATAIATGTAPIGMATGDFNGDGFKDAIVTNISSGTASVFRGNGDGTFMARVDYTVGTSPFHVSTADYNSDGRPDIAVSNSASNTVSVLLGTGASGSYTFLPKSDYATGTTPYGNASADVTGDGVTDIIISNYASGTLSVWVGVGNGSFSSRIDYPIGSGSNIQDIEVADFDGNGKVDVAGPSRSTMLSLFTFFQKNGVLIPNHYDVPTYGVGYYLASGDFNADGALDIVQSNYTATGKISILLNNNNNTGSFATKVDYNTTIPNVAGVAVADFNNDGKQDIVACDRNGAAGTSVSVFTGVGDGTFNARSGYTTALDPWSVAAGDINNDGRIDIISGNYTASNISVLLGNGDGTFQAKTDVSTHANPRSVTIADFNNDKKMDVMTCSNNTGKAGVMLGNGSGGFAAMVEYAIGGTVYNCRVGDFNADGNLDIAGANTGTGNIGLILGTGSGTFGAATTFPTLGLPVDFTIGDFSGDGKLDIYTTPWSTGSGVMSLLIGNGSGSFAAPVSYYMRPSSEYSHHAISGDFNGDGKLDAATNSVPSAVLYVVPGI